MHLLTHTKCQWRQLALHLLTYSCSQSQQHPLTAQCISSSVTAASGGSPRTAAQRASCLSCIPHFATRHCQRCSAAAAAPVLLRVHGNPQTLNRLTGTLYIGRLTSPPLIFRWHAASACHGMTPRCFMSGLNSSHTINLPFLHLAVARGSLPLTPAVNRSTLPHLHT